jgi:spermidine synthase
VGKRKERAAGERSSGARGRSGASRSDPRTTDRTPGSPARLAGVIACFVLSGFAALLYQTAWLRQFSLVFGTSELAVATVLAAYMAGLALGAALAARFLGRIRRPVLCYGLLEAGIALSALAVPALLALASALYGHALGGRPEPPDAASLGQPVFYLAVGFVVLAVPTAFMGATLPLLTRHAVRNDRELGPRVALLYAANTAGAVLGTLGAGFLLLPALGLRATVATGALVNLLVFLVAWRLARAEPGRGTAGDAAGPASATREPPATFRGSCLLPLLGGGRPLRERLEAAFRSQPVWILPLMLVSGANAFFYEVLWTRLLSHILGGSLHAFSTMLAAFLTGIALGGGLAGRLAIRRERAAVVFAGAQLAVALASIGIYAWMGHAVPESRTPADLIVFATGVLLPATFFIGATFPLAVRILARDESDAGASTARIYAWNTVGAIAGAVLAGFVLIPALGFEGSIRLAVCVNLGLAALALACTTRVSLLLPAALAAGGIAVLLFYAPARPQAVIASSPHPSQRLEEAKIHFYAVGRSSTVLVFADSGSYHLRTNGLDESVVRARGAPPRLDAAAWLTALPVVARPDTRTMLVIGFGGGTSLEGVPPSVSSVDVVELEPEVIRANQTLAGLRERDPLADPRLRIVLNDARNALRLTSKRWDAIVSQPSHPWTAGASHLFTREFVALAKDHLSEDGVFVQWMSANLLTEPLLRSLVATLAAEFAHVRVYGPNPLSLIFLASDAPLDLELGLARTGRPLAEDVAHFAALGMRSLEDLLAALALDSPGAKALAAGAAPSTDDANRVATGSRTRLDGLGPAELARLFGPHDPLLAPSSWVHGQLGDQIAWVHLADRMRRLAKEGRVAGLAAALADESDRLAIEGWMQQRAGNRAQAQRTLRRAIEADPANQQARFLLAQDSLGGIEGTAAPEEAFDAAVQGLSGAPLAVLRGRGYARQRDWRALARLEPELARSRVTDTWFAEAARLRAEWRIRSVEDRQALARQALELVDAALHVMSSSDLRRLRVECAVALGDEDLLAQSARSFVAGIDGRLSRSMSRGSRIPASESEQMRRQLTAINAQLEGPLGAEHEGASQVLRRSRELLALLERLHARL